MMVTTAIGLVMGGIILEPSSLTDRLLMIIPDDGSLLLPMERLLPLEHTVMMGRVNPLAMFVAAA